MRKLHQRGFTIVETMVAVALSLIVLAGVMAVMYSSKVVYNENERVGRLQENGRAALDLILRDLRGAGFPGCAQPIDGLFDIRNQLDFDPATDIEWNLTEPVYGFDSNGANWDPAIDATLTPDATAGNDIIVVRTIPTGAPSMRVDSMITAAASTFTVQKGEGEKLDVGTPAVISDCGNATVFVVSGFSSIAGTSSDITLATGGGPPANASANLGSAFTRGARVAPIQSVTYYIAPNAAGTGPSLWRVISDGAPQEIAPGVEAMQVKYGVDSNAADNQVTVDEYVDADDVDDWAEVVSVSLALLVRSAEQNAQELDSRDYTLLDVTLPKFNDNFQRALFTTTVTLRNRTT